MKATELVKSIVDKLITRIKELPDGTRTSTSRLMDDIGYCFGEYDKEMFDIHFLLLETAEAENIFLDNSSHYGKYEGLPFNLDYLIYHNTKTYWYCDVFVKGISHPYSYISETGYIEECSFVEIPFGSSNLHIIGFSQFCRPYMENNAPYPVNRTKHIIRLATKEEYDAQPDIDDIDWRNPTKNDLFVDIEAYLYEEDWESVYHWAVEHEGSNNEAVQEKVIECYMKLGESGHSVGYLNLGVLYYDGRIVEQDYKEAFRYYKLAADAGNARASCNCGYCYYYGRHQEPDYDMAFQYFSRGALLYDDANCLYKLGDMCLNGYGVEKNEKFAFQFYVRALVRCRESEEDAFCLGDAQMRVGKCLLHGIGVDCDPVEAHKLLCSALINFYDRRKTDPFVSTLIRETKELVREVEDMLDEDTIA